MKDIRIRICIPLLIPANLGMNFEEEIALVQRLQELYFVLTLNSNTSNMLELQDRSPATDTITISLDPRLGKVSEPAASNVSSKPLP